MEKFEIGIITKPQGLKGDVRVKLYSNDFSVLNELDEIYINNKKVFIEKKTDRNTFVVLKLEGINDIDVAEKLRNTPVFVEKDDIVLYDDEILVSDIIGYKLVSKNKIVLGTVKDVRNYGAGDVYTILNPSLKEFMFINAKNVILEVNDEAKLVVVDEVILKDLCV